MFHKKKKGYISIEYIIVAGIALIAASFIFVASLPTYTTQADTKLQGVIDLISGDETVITNN